MKRICARLLTLAIVAVGAPFQVQGAGVTLVTHGLNGNIDGWVSAMANRIAAYPLFPGTNFSCYDIYFTQSNSAYVPTWRRVSGRAPQNTDAAEILVRLDWRQLANDDYNTYQVAGLVAPVLLQNGFISEWPGHALAELPMHLIGHSRGGSLVCELTKLLGQSGVWIDHLTTLDPHPLNNDGFNDFPYFQVDAPARTYESVLFHDNYFQELNFIAYGEPVAGAYIRQLTTLSGGYGGLTASHSDVHLWYHGTLDFRVPADDSEATITAAERQAWWTVFEQSGANAGFRYSLIGRGSRTANVQPDGPGTSRINDGYNQKWDLGGGTNANRTALGANNGNWATLLRLQLLTTNLVAYGDTNIIEFHYQWARGTNQQATVSIYLDDDLNPYNGNESWVRDFTVTGTTAAQVLRRSGRMVLEATNAVPGDHTLFAKVTANSRSRYLYSPETLSVMSSFTPPRLAIAKHSLTNVQVQVTGAVGQRIVLESSPNLQTWSTIATNWLTQPIWTLIQTPLNDRFYRASVR